MTHEHGYNLKSVKLPRLSGLALKIVTAMMENRVTRLLLRNNFLVNGGITRLRSIDVPGQPTVYPVHRTESAAPTSLRKAPAPASVRPRSESSFQFRSVEDFQEAYRSGTVTPVAVAHRFLDALGAFESMNPPLRAFVAVDDEDLLKQAQASARRWAEGSPLGPLDGVPVAVKDEIDLAGYPTLVGTQFLPADHAVRDAFTVSRLRAAGALLVGKTNMHEIGIDTTGRNPHFGTPRNPYATDRYTGGSSSGSAAAVASGLCPVAVGADGGGSIRIPSAFCGVTGLKPTFGRVSERGAAPLCWSVAHIGPIAADARSAALAYGVMAGPDPEDVNSLIQPPVRTLQDLPDLTGLRIGIFEPWFDHADPEIVKACRSTLDSFTSLGMVVRKITIPDLDSARAAHTVTILSEMAAAMKPYYGRHRTEFDTHTRLMLGLAACFTAGDYLQAQKVRTRTIASFMDAFTDADVIVTPATAVPAPLIRTDALAGHESDPTITTEIMRFAVTGNLTGFPALSFPVGYTTGGLPIGMQVMGKPWEEEVLLAVAMASERFLEREKPAYFVDLLGND